MVNHWGVRKTFTISCMVGGGGLDIFVHKIAGKHQFLDSQNQNPPLCSKL